MTDRDRRWFALVGLLAIGVSIVALLPTAPPTTPPELAPLRYNHPGLVVDLGVGLWAWPIPCDADGDGDYDLVVSCPDKPSNGVWVFENATGDTRREAMPLFRPARRLGPTVSHLMPSYVDGRLRVLSPGFEYDDLPTAGIARRKPLSATANWYVPNGPQKKGPGVRHNQWRLADFDGDGLEDLVCGIEDWSDYGWDDAYDQDGRWRNGPLHGFVFVFSGAAGGGFATNAIQLEAGGRPIRVMAGPNGSIQGPAEAKWGYTTFSVADWNGDGLPDIVLNSILGDIEWLENVGTRTKPRLAEAKPVEVAWEGEPPQLGWGWRRPVGRHLLTQWRTTPLVHDINGDGLADLAMLDHEGYLAYFERERRDDVVVLLPPKRWFLDEAGRPLRLNDNQAGGSGRRKLCLVDWDGDGRLDLLVNSRNADLLRQTGETDGPWTFAKAGPLANRNIEGHDVSPAVVDFDGDRVPDYLGGAEDGRAYFLKNPRSSR